LKQIDRCNTASLEGDEARFSYAVESLLSMLPKEHRVKLEAEQAKEVYTSKSEDYIYAYSCGKPMGSPENPIYRNKPTDWNYDGGEPILVSPRLEESENIDYQILYRMILAELQDVGATWKVEPRDNIGRRIKPVPTPLIKLKDGKMVRILIQKGMDALEEVGGVIEDSQPVITPSEPDDGGPTEEDFEDDEDDQDLDKDDLEAMFPEDKEDEKENDGTGTDK